MVSHHRGHAVLEWPSSQAAPRGGRSIAAFDLDTSGLAADQVEVGGLRRRLRRVGRLGEVGGCRRAGDREVGEVQRLEGVRAVEVGRGKLLGAAGRVVGAAGTRVWARWAAAEVRLVMAGQLWKK